MHDGKGYACDELKRAEEADLALSFHAGSPPRSTEDEGNKTKSSGMKASAPAPQQKNLPRHPSPELGVDGEGAEQRKKSYTGKFTLDLRLRPRGHLLLPSHSDSPRTSFLPGGKLHRERRSERH